MKIRKIYKYMRLYNSVLKVYSKKSSLNFVNEKQNVLFESQML